jgi:hypothetical protein
MHTVRQRCLRVFSIVCLVVAFAAAVCCGLNAATRPQLSETQCHALPAPIARVCEPRMTPPFNAVNGPGHNSGRSRLSDRPHAAIAIAAG